MLGDASVFFIINTHSLWLLCLCGSHTEKSTQIILATARVDTTYSWQSCKSWCHLNHRFDGFWVWAALLLPGTPPIDLQITHQFDAHRENFAKRNESDLQNPVDHTKGMRVTSSPELAWSKKIVAQHWWGWQQLYKYVSIQWLCLLDDPEYNSQISVTSVFQLMWMQQNAQVKCQLSSSSWLQHHRCGFWQNLISLYHEPSLEAYTVLTIIHRSVNCLFRPGHDSWTNGKHYAPHNNRKH